MRRFFNKAIWLFAHKIPWKPILIWGPWVFILGILLFYGIENWRGQRALDRVLAEAKKDGYSLNWRDYTPEPNNDSTNLITHPIFDEDKNDVLRRTSQLMKIGRAPKGISTNRSDFKKPRDLRLLTSKIDLRLWLEPSIRPATEKEAAENLDELRKPRRKLLDDFFAAQQTKTLSVGARLKDFIPTNENSSLSSQIRFLSIAAACSEDALIASILGDLDRALDRLESNQMLLNAEVPQVLYARLIDASVQSESNAIAETILRSQKATKKQLQRLHRLLEPSLVKNLDQTILGEMAAQTVIVEHLVKHRHLLTTDSPLAAALVAAGLTSKPTKWEEALSEAFDFLLRRIPSGWLRGAHADKLEETLAQIRGLDFKKLADRRLFLERVSQPEEKSSFVNDLLGGSGTQFWKNPFTRLQLIEMECHLMRIATQLELYRLREGNYPDNLSQLPIAIEDDFFSGEPLHYKLKEDGTPHLWSIGPDQIDDGGLPSQLRSHHERGDLLWMLTPIPNLDEDDWRRALR